MTEHHHDPFVEACAQCAASRPTERDRELVHLPRNRGVRGVATHDSTMRSAVTAAWEAVRAEHHDLHPTVEIDMTNIDVGSDETSIGEQIITEMLRVSTLWRLERLRKEVTSRQGRYLNYNFAVAARDFGLEWPGGSPDPRRGYRGVVMTPDTRVIYASEIGAINVAHGELPSETVVVSDRTILPGDTERVTFPPVGRRRPVRGQRQAVRGVCACGRILRMAHSTASIALVLCGQCGEAFRFDDSPASSDGDKPLGRSEQPSWAER